MLSVRQLTKVIAPIVAIAAILLAWMVVPDQSLHASVSSGRGLTRRVRIAQLRPQPVSPVAPPIFMGPPSMGVVVAQHSVEATVDGPVANVHVTQVFRNDGSARPKASTSSPCPRTPRSATSS